MRTGIVLAGGEATRLPNKPLLPLVSGKPAITSSIDLCLRSGAKTTVVVVPPQSVIPMVLKSHGYDNLIYALQRVPVGVVNAIRLGIEAVSGVDRFIVSFCDNVFPDDEVVPDLAADAYASIREQPGAQAIHLDRFLAGIWVDRKNPHLEAQCLAGWYVLPRRWPMEATSTLSSVEFLNTMKAQGVVMPKDGWYDIGTVDSYYAYWKANS